MAAKKIKYADKGHGFGKTGAPMDPAQKKAKLAVRQGASVARNADAAKSEKKRFGNSSGSQPILDKSRKDLNKTLGRKVAGAGMKAKKAATGGTTQTGKRGGKFTVVNGYKVYSKK